MGANGAPRVEDPSDWYVWHFTHITNLRRITAAGELRCASSTTPTTEVASAAVKSLRELRRVELPPPYPPGLTVSDHVPWYFAAKSPMLYVVCNGYGEYKGGPDPLVFLGMKLGDLAESGLPWCASSGNAAAGWTSFATGLENVPNIVDFELLRAKQWNNTGDDIDRKSRRAAEVLVAAPVPLSLVSLVVVRTDAMLTAARQELGTVVGSGQYAVVPDFYY